MIIFLIIAFSLLSAEQASDTLIRNVRHAYENHQLYDLVNAYSDKQKILLVSTLQNKELTREGFYFQTVSLILGPVLSNMFTSEIQSLIMCFENDRNLEGFYRTHQYHLFDPNKWLLKLWGRSQQFWGKLSFIEAFEANPEFKSYRDEIVSKKRKHVKSVL